jgi:hypothetical protein
MSASNTSIVSARVNLRSKFLDEMNLGGNSLSGHFEKACALVKGYEKNQFSELEFWKNLELFC